MFAIVGDHTVLGKAHGVAALKSHGDERRWEEKDPGGVSHLLCRLLSLYIFPPHDAKNAHGRKEEGDVFSFDDGRRHAAAEIHFETFEAKQRDLFQPICYREQEGGNFSSPFVFCGLA